MSAGDVGDGADRLPRPRPALEQSVDPAAVRADDDLIEALAAGLIKPPVRRPESGDVDEQLVALLSSWVADVRPETMLHRPADHWPALDGARARRRSTGQVGVVTPPSGVDAGVPCAGEPTVSIPVVPGASATISDSGDQDAAADTRPIPLLASIPQLASIPLVPAVRLVPPVRRRLPWLPIQRLAAAAALVAMAGSGLVLGAWDAKPGTALWPVTRVVFAEKARSVQAAVDVVSNLTRARNAFAAHHVTEARSAYQDALDQLGAVAPAEGQAALTQETSTIALQLGLPAPTTAQTGVVTSDNHDVLATDTAGDTTGNAPGDAGDTTAPATTDTDIAVLAGGTTPGPAAAVAPHAVAPVVVVPPHSTAASDHLIDTAAVPRATTAIPTTIAAAPATTTDPVPPTTRDTTAADPTSTTASTSSDPVSDTTAADPRGTPGPTGTDQVIPPPDPDPSDTTVTGGGATDAPGGDPQADSSSDPPGGDGHGTAVPAPGGDG